MRKFLKFIVFAGLLIQFGLAYGVNRETTFFSKAKENSAFSKESLSLSHFAQPCFERSNPDLKLNHRNPVNASCFNTATPLFYFFAEQNPKIILSDQDVDRCSKVSILLFPFHYFW